MNNANDRPTHNLSFALISVVTDISVDNYKKVLK